MRIIAGAWRGRALKAPPGETTRPTADRVRQALFDMLWHAPWAGPDAIRDATILDAFAGTGALGLEALSRGAAFAHFIDSDRTALATLRANIAACHAGPRTRILTCDARHPPPGVACSLVFLDPPYGQDLVPQAVTALTASGWLTADTLLIAEISRTDPLPTDAALLADRAHGAARLLVWRLYQPALRPTLAA